MGATSTAVAASNRRMHFQGSEFRVTDTQLETRTSETTPSNATDMLVVRDLHKSIRNGVRMVDILKGIDFAIPRGQFAAIMGSSGSGKSTLLGLLAGLDTPSSGDVFVNGTAISYLPEDKLAQVRGRSIGFVFQ